MGKKAWVLSGGGARGAYQAGAMINLMKTECPEAIYGTSTGALNACGMSFRGSVWLESMWRSLRRRRDVFGTSWNPFDGGYYSSAPLEALIKKAMEDQKPVCPVTVTYVDMNLGETMYASTKTCFPSDFPLKVLASASIPGVVPPVDGHYCDGGLTDNIPLAKAVKDGFDDITVVLCSNRSMPIAADYNQPKTLAYCLRALDIMFNNSSKDDLRITLDRNDIEGFKQIKLQIIEPPMSYMYGTLEFTPEAIFDGIELGKNWRSHNAATSLGV